MSSPTTEKRAGGGYQSPAGAAAAQLPGAGPGTKPGKRGLFNRFLDGVEKVGNALPHPATIFAILALAVVFVSALAASLGVQATHPGTGEVITVRNLLTGDGFRWIWSSLESNMINFPPLGLVLVVMIGIGVAEGSGLLTSLVRFLVLKARKNLITAALVLAGVFSHVASEAGYVILIPLGATIFLALGRHPIAGLAAAFCGVSGGFGANFVITSIDPILAGISQEAARMIDPAIQVNPAVNLYFMFASAILITVVGTWVTEKIVEPRLGTYKGKFVGESIEQLTNREKKGLLWAGISLLALSGLMAAMALPENGLLRTPGKGLLQSTFFDGMIVVIMLLFLVPGLVYGIVTGTVKNDKDAVKHMTSSMGTMASYIVLVFFAAQFVYFFSYSNLGSILAINGAEFLKGVGITDIPLMISFIFLCAFINLFMGSASAKWAIMGPVFVPMFMLLGFHPAMTQAVFRIGDSVTNVITPMMSYFALIVSFATKYDDEYGLGTIISTMLPYSLFFLLAWSALLIIWILLGLPVGPDGPIHYMVGMTP